MSSSASTSTTPDPTPIPSRRKYVKRPRTKPLGRGKACSNCRHLKIKCDGGRPACGQCVRIPRDDECEYADCPSRLTIMQDHITRLQSCIDELAGSSTSERSGDYAFPYSVANLHGFDLPTGSVGHSSRSGIPLAHKNAFYSPISTHMSTEAPTGVSSTTFPSNEILFGFCLNESRFRTALAADLVPSSLRYALYLCGTYVKLSSINPQLLCTLLGQLPMEKAQCTTISGAIYLIQAEILLGYYFLHENLLVEAQHYSNDAIAFATTLGLHKTPALPLEDTIEQGERIDTFWSAFCLQKTLALACRGNIPCVGVGVLQDDKDIDIPWPLHRRDYEQGFLPAPTTRSSTLQSMFHSFSTNIAANSVPALFVRAIILLDCSVCLFDRWNHVSPEVKLCLMNGKETLERAMVQALEDINNVLCSSSNDESKSRLHLTQAMVHCASAVAQLEDSAETRRDRRIAARKMLDALRQDGEKEPMVVGAICLALVHCCTTQRGRARDAEHYPGRYSFDGTRRLGV
ncbi:hypothetical protein CYLTODRAFT_492421 [Cylindrobasidium torrendii FP15055 ss-10]|uniref:Zn(2)-C6 fungal-type domain-containing protein n=1 Tax=Cylindrobasidium torrendii FP15055 ss-10 TaxID=1314674 RepID=A0A0D7B719_9AGAR|nr:hypothetical protein CYLTODRAFT_492421 [Cylindrobasidium torrendii FP15055 ss-10]